MKKNYKFINFKSLFFKKIKKKEIQILRKERNRQSIRKTMLDQKIISKAEQIKWYKETQKEKDSKYLSIYYKNLIIGCASIKKISKINKNCTWGFFIFEKYFGNFGVIVEYKLIDYMFTKYNLYKIFGRTLSTNVKILKIHKRFGFNIEGNLKNQIFINNKKYDLILSSLYKKDWDKNKKRIKLLFM